MGLAKRRLYKPERKPARMKGVLHEQAPVGCPDASVKEIAMAIAALCQSVAIDIGRGGSYDAIKDEYVIVGKNRMTGKAQDFKVEGVAVAALINQLRLWNGGTPFDQHALTNAVGGVYGGNRSAVR